MPVTVLTRRRFLRAVGVVPLVVSRRLLAARGQDAASFRGGAAGQSRVLDGFALRWCPAGRFRMGSPPDEPGRRPDESAVDVTLTRGFWAGQSEVTQGQWRRIVGAFPDRMPTTAFGLGDEYPVYWVNFEQAEAFCAALTSSARRSGALPPAWTVALPTEAQWEYACRAGTTTATSFGERLTPSVANFDPDADTRAVRLAGGARPVGSYRANAWGLSDMHGNVWEWCRDYYHAQLPGGTDPDLSAVEGERNRDGSYSRVRRGGAWIESPAFCRSAGRLRYEPYRGSDHIGFRFVIEERR